jgi:hypothetical protein
MCTEVPLDIPASRGNKAEVRRNCPFLPDTMEAEPRNLRVNLSCLRITDLEAMTPPPAPILLTARFAGIIWEELPINSIPIVEGRSVQSAGFALRLRGRCRA